MEITFKLIFIGVIAFPQIKEKLQPSLNQHQRWLFSILISGIIVAVEEAALVYH